MAVTRPCPRCQNPLEIPQPVPEQIQCAKCGAVIKSKKNVAAAEAEAAKAPANIAAKPAASAAAAAASSSAATVSAAASAVTAPTAEQWFYSQGTQRCGPCTREELKQLIGAGKVRSQDLIWRTGFAEWRPAGAVPEVATALPAAETPMALAAGEDFQILVETPPAPGAPAPDLVKVSEVSKPRRPSRFMSFLHSVLPKPVFFGLAGALGGLLGVLLLGELLWYLLHPAPPVIEPLKIAVPKTLTVFPGNRNRLVVKIARQKYEGPVRLTAAGLPKGVKISGATIPATETEAELYVEANENAAPDTYEVEMRAVAPNQEAVKAAHKMALIVEPSPPTLLLTVSPAVTLYPGTQNKLGFIIARRLFEGPVRLEVLDLPKDVAIPLVPLPEGVNEGGMDIVVGPGAKPGFHRLKIEVRSLMKHKIATREEFNLNIEPPPGKLQLAVSPQVTVYPGTKNKITVKIARQEFKDPVQIDVTGAPAHVQIPSVTIPSDKTEAEMELSAGKEVVAGGAPVNLRVNAKVDGPEKIATSMPLQLVVQPTPPTLQLAVSPKVGAYPGGKTSFAVKIARQRFKGPVRLEISPTAHVAVPALIIPEDKADGTMEVAVNASALGLPLPHTMVVPVIARSVEGPAVATEKVQIELLAPPSDLAVTVSPEVDIYQAGKCSFTIKVARTGFLGPVQIAFTNVPAGVTLPPAVITANDIILKGQATLDVDPKKYELEVTGTGPKAPDGKVPTTTKKFALTVKKFDPTIRPPLDIVFVLDVTQSLDPQIAGIKNGIGQFVKGLKDRELEARIGLLGFRDITVPDEVHFELLKFNGQLFTTDTKVFADEVGKLKASGGGDDPESSLDAIVKAANYPFRPKALKVLLLITDEKPQTKGNSVTMAIAQQLLKDKKIDQVHLIIKKADLPNYAGLQQTAKGGVFDFHEASKKAEGFASILPLLSKEIATTIGAPDASSKDPPQPEPAKEPPSPAGEKAPEPPAETRPATPTPQQPQAPQAGVVEPIKVAPPVPPVAAEVAPPRAELPSLQGVQSNQMFAEKDQFQLLIAIALWTAALAGGIALVLVTAQKRYLRQSWLSLGEAGKALGAGLLAGLLAGAVGQWFFHLTIKLTSGDAGEKLISAAWGNLISFLSFLLAWAILGGLIGAGMGFFVPNLKWRRAFAGGCIGGSIGAVGYTLVSLWAGETLGRWIGAALLGFFIGLMVALAELAFRRYWLEVAFGPREIRTVTLGPSTVALGGDEKLAGVYVAGAPPKALGFRVDKNQVYCEDFVGGKTAVVSPGDLRELGTVKVKVCSAASAQATGASLQLVMTKNLPLMRGMPLTSEDIPGLEPQGSDGSVALVSPRPNDPKIFLLRNRSKQPWVVTEADGKRRNVDPGMGVELASRCEIDFGQAKATLDPAQETTPSSTAAPAEKS